MKKIITLLITLTMVLTMAVPAFATDNQAPAESAPTEVKLTSKQVRAITPKNFKATSYSYTKIKTSWDKIEGVDGYKVYRATSKNGSYKLVRTTTSANTLSYINTERTTGKTYYYKMRGYKKIGKTTYYTKFSPVKSTSARLTKPTVTVTLGGTDKNPYDRTPKSTWKAISGASGYEVYRTREGKNSYKKICTTKKTSFTDSYSTDFKYYYTYEYKVRAYRIVNGKKIYSYFSTPKKYVPDWTMEELMPELIAYGESIEGKRLEFTDQYDENDEPIHKLYTGPEGATYTMDHFIGHIEDPTTESGYRGVRYGETDATKDPTFKRYTPENSSWSAMFPMEIDYYWSKEIALKEMKSAIKASIKGQFEDNPLVWYPADEQFEAGWGGIDSFSLYTRKNRAGYDFYVMF
ncbi:hypothetical protein [Emergencia sp. 1XD21-10]|uniref:hypothetical protein n=1 Tax=Emergencia sp. 1XD21-10 TaxID=2304569 RepID=UPI00137A738A|nr:hypothetical protein [Emergencia sp. 1XD21-10]NCE98832.1 hypothetical protein [Emergencia sp. 1XD21-10]